MRRLVQLSVIVVAIGLLTAAALAVIAIAQGGSSNVYDEDYVVNADGSGLRQLTHDNHFHDGTVWSPDSRTIATATSGLKSVGGAGGEQTSQPALGPIELIPADGAGPRDLSLGDDVQDVGWQSDDRLVALSPPASAQDPAGEPLGVGASAVVFDTNGQILHRIAVRAISASAWSPDGRTLAYLTTTSDGQPLPTLWLQPVDGGPRRRVAQLIGSPQLNDSDLSWAPDSRSLLVVLSDSAGASLWLVPTAAGQRPRRLDINFGDIGPPAISPNGRLVALDANLVISRRGGATYTGNFLVLVPTSGGPARRLAGDEGAGAVWSPDGREIAFVADRQDTPGAGDQPYDTVKTIWPDGSHEQAVVRLPGMSLDDLSWSPDGRRIAFDAGVWQPSD